MAIKHRKVSAKADGGDSTLVLPSDWNDTHTLDTTQGQVLVTGAGGEVVGDAGLTYDPATDALTVGGAVITGAPSASAPSLVLTPGGTSPALVSGGLWWNGTNLYFYNGSVTRDLVAYPSWNNIDNPYTHKTFTMGSSRTTYITTAAAQTGYNAAFIYSHNNSVAFSNAANHTSMLANPAAGASGWLLHLSCQNGSPSTSYLPLIVTAPGYNLNNYLYGTAAQISGKVKIAGDIDLLAGPGTPSPKGGLLRFGTGAAPDSLLDGQMWWDGSALNFYNGTTTKNLLAAGGGTPAGANAQVQFNDNGAFGASENLTFDGYSFATGRTYLYRRDTAHGVGSTNPVLYLMGGPGDTTAGAVGDGSQIRFQAHDDTGGTFEATKITSRVEDATSGATYGSMHLTVTDNGATAGSDGSGTGLHLTSTAATYTSAHGSVALTGTDDGHDQGVEVHGDGTYFTGFYAERAGYGNVRLNVGTSPQLRLADDVSATTVALENQGGATSLRNGAGSDLRMDGAGLTFWDGTTTHDLLASGGSPAGTGTEVQYRDGTSFGAAANVNISAAGNLLLDVTTDPATPAADTVSVYARKRAGRSLLAMIGPSGVDNSLQPQLWGNRIILWSPNTTTTMSNIGMGGTIAATASTPTPAMTNLGTSLDRTQFTTSTTAGNAAGIRAPRNTLYGGNASTPGGWFFHARFNQGSLHTTGVQKMVGVSSSTAALAGDPSSSMADFCGMCLDAADANWQFTRRTASGTATKVNLGVAAAANQVFDLAMYVKPNQPDGLYVRVTQYANSGVATVLLDTVYTTSIPGATTLLGPHFQVRNGALTAAHDMALARLYIESDF